MNEYINRRRKAWLRTSKAQKNIERSICEYKQSIKASENIPEKKGMVAGVLYNILLSIYQAIYVIILSQIKRILE